MTSQTYPDLKQLMIEQADLLDGKTVEKEVVLDGRSELSVLKFDSTQWINELEFLKEISPSQPEYVGALLKTENGSEITLTLAEGEKGVLKHMVYDKRSDQFQFIKATFHEDKDIYSHHTERF